MKPIFYRKVLKNGMTVIFEKRNLPIVSAAIAVRVGGINENEEEKNKSEIMITPEKDREIKERWHTLEGVKDYLNERAEVYLHLSKDKYTDEGIKMGLEMSKNFSGLNEDLEKGHFEKVLRSVETSLENGLHWDTNRNRNKFTGEKTELVMQRHGFSSPSDIDRLSENKIMQERLRAMADILTEKEYEKRGRALKPANYEEITDYLGKEIKLWNMDNDPYTISLKEAMQKRNYSELADQIDTSLGVAVFQHEQIKAGNQDMKRAVEGGRHITNATAYLVSQIENLRRYRKFLYEKSSERV